MSAPSAARVPRMTNRSSDLTAAGSGTGSLNAAEVCTMGSTLSTASRNAASRSFSSRCCLAGRMRSNCRRTAATKLSRVKS